MTSTTTGFGVFTAINQVQAALAKTGIQKNQQNQQQRYNFRGIDDIYNALGPKLAEFGVCIHANCVGSSSGGSCHPARRQNESRYIESET